MSICITAVCTQGQGIYLSPEGEKYIGTWAGGKKHGRRSTNMIVLLHSMIHTQYSIYYNSTIMQQYILFISIYFTYIIPTHYHYITCTSIYYINTLSYILQARVAIYSSMATSTMVSSPRTRRTVQGSTTMLTVIYLPDNG